MRTLLQNAEKTVDCKNSQVINVHEYKRVLRQRRIMASATVGTLVNIFINKKNIS